MNHSKVQTNKAPAPGNYSQARIIEINEYKIVYTALVTGNHPITDEVASDINSQTKQTLENIKAIIEEAGGTMRDIVRVNVLFENMERDKKGFEEEYVKFFDKDLMPARSISEVNVVPLKSENTVIGIEVIAYIYKQY